jgi:hypothetical protein
MGLTYRIDRANRLVRSRGSGVLTIQVIQEFYSKLQADPAFEPDYRTLGDLREVTEIAVTSNQLAASASLPIFRAGTRRALVATSDLVYGMLRAYATFNEHMGQTVRVFRDLPTAERWLETGQEELWRDG